MTGDRNLNALLLTAIVVAGAIAAGAPAPVGASTAAANVAVDGTITDANGNSASDDTLAFHSYELSDGTGNLTDANGQYDVTLSRDATYRVEYRQSDGGGAASPDFPKDGSADVYAFGSRTYGGDATEDYRVPEGHALDVSVVDPSGNPIPDAVVEVTHENGEARSTIQMVTRSDGLAEHPGSDGTGVEVNTSTGGAIDVRVEPPSAEYTANATVDRLEVTGDRTLELVLYPASVVDGDVSYADGSVASDVVVTFRPASTGASVDNVTDGQGNYGAQVATADWDAYEVSYRQIGIDRGVDYPKDGYVDVYPFGAESYGSNTTAPRVIPRGNLVNVTVVDENGDHLEGARVSVSQERNGAQTGVSAPTNARGVMVHPGSDGPGFEVDGPVRVHASKTGYTSNGTDVTVDSTTGDVRVTLTLREAVTVSGSVTEADGSTAATDDGIVFTSGAHSDGQLTDGSGGYAVDLLSGETYGVYYEQNPPGTGSVAYPKDGTVDVYAFGTERYTTDTSGVDRQLPGGHRLNVTVVDASGTELQDARVRVSQSVDGAGVGVSANTTADGLMVHPQSDGPGVEVDGAVEVAAHPPDGTDLRANSTSLTVTQDRGITIELRRPTDVTGQIEYADGSTVAADEVVYLNGPEVTLVRTAADGTFDSGVVDPGNYSVGYTQTTTSGDRPFEPHDGNPDVYYVTSVDADGPTDVGTHTLPAAHEVNVTVVDDTGAPIENASVEVVALAPDGRIGSAWFARNGTGADGLLRLAGKDRPGVELAGEYAILAAGPHNSTAYRHEISRTNVTVAGDRELTLTVDRTNVAPRSHDFGTVATDSSETVTVTVTNDGDVDYAVAGTSVVGADPGEFQVVGGDGSFTLAPGESRDVTVAFAPSSTGSKSAAVRFENPESSAGPPLEVPLSGSGETASAPTDTPIPADTATPTPTSTATTTDDGSTGSPEDDTPTPSPAEASTATPTDSPTDGATPADGTTPTDGSTPPADGGNQTPTGTSTGAPGFGLALAPFALLGAVLLTRRRP